MGRIVLQQEVNVTRAAEKKVIEIINQHFDADIRKAGSMVSLTAENVHYIWIKSQIRERKWEKFCREYKGEELPEQQVRVNKWNTNDLWVIAPDEKRDFSGGVRLTYGRMVCPYCNGGGIADCEICHGDGRVPCNECGGKGYLEKSCKKPKKQICHLCDGNGCRRCSYKGWVVREDIEREKVRCPICWGEGETVCHTCRGRGKARCSSCNGTGDALTGFNLIQKSVIRENVAWSLSKHLEYLLEKPTTWAELGECTILDEFSSADGSAAHLNYDGDHAEELCGWYDNTMELFNSGDSRCNCQIGKLLEKTWYIYTIKLKKFPNLKPLDEPVSFAVSLADGISPKSVDIIWNLMNGY